MARTALSPVLGKLLEALSPKVLRETVLLPFDVAREDFEPRFVSTSSYEDALDELVRFIQHVKRKWLRTDVEWPRDLARDEARRLLASAAGGPDHRAGERAAMAMIRHGDRGGLRGVLDLVVSMLQAQALGQYLDTVILPQVNKLPLEDSLALAQAYLEEFDTVPGLDLEHPALIVDRWEQVLHEHASLATGIAPVHTSAFRQTRPPRRRRPRTS